MSFFKSIAFILLYYITMSKFGVKFDSLEGVLVGVVITILFTKDNKEDTR